MMQRALYIILVLSFSVGVLADSSDREKLRQRLDQLFVWKVSDRLQLTSAKESEFNKEYKKLSDEKTKLSQSLDDLSDQMGRERNDKKKLGKLLMTYRQVAKEYSKAQESELDVMGHVLDNNQLAEYVILKREMFHKFRDVLTTVGSQKTAENGLMPKATPLKEPEVIQEK